ncbi:TPA: 30S ribosomal protein S13 [Candidatus Micrarchaeota archaeon]|nr:30S ribosomal protein S13 [Candidatus Micrarchaeota archaeon]
MERGIVRVADVDLDGKQPLHRALLRIKGIGANFAVMVERVFSEETGIDPATPLGNIPEDKIPLLEDIIRNPVAHGIPPWVVNTPKDMATGEDKHYVGVDLEVKEREILKREADMGSYRGLRRVWGLKVRGQRTKSKGRKNKISPRIRKKKR